MSYVNKAGVNKELLGQTINSLFEEAESKKKKNYGLRRA